MATEWEAVWQEHWDQAQDYAETGAVYARISDDREGLEQGVIRQVKDCLDLATASGVRIPRDLVLVDNDRGASNLSRKTRPAYEAMVERIEGGGVRHVFAYSNSRLTRRPREFDYLVELHQRVGVQYHTVVSGKDDLSTADGRMVAGIKAQIDSAEAERTGERVRRHRLDAAQSGRTWTSGGRAFGWLDDRETEHPVEAKAIRTAAADILAGKALIEVCREWNEAGLLTARGNEWSPAQLTQLLRSPRLTGWRVHHGEIALDRAGEPVRGGWDVILDQTTFDRLAELRRGRTGKVRQPRRGARQYMLSSIARCGICGGPMAGQRIDDVVYNYFCAGNPANRDHTNTASGRAVDRVVTAQVFLVAAQQDVEAPEVGDYPEEARLAEVNEELREVMRKIREGSKIPKQMLWAEAERLGERVEELERGRDEWLVASTAPAPTPDLTLEKWRGMSVPEKQAHIEAALGTVIIQPPTTRRPGSRFDPSRVTYA